MAWRLHDHATIYFAQIYNTLYTRLGRNTMAFGHTRYQAACSGHVSFHCFRGSIQFVLHRHQAKSYLPAFTSRRRRDTHYRRMEGGCKWKAVPGSAHLPCQTFVKSTCLVYCYTHHRKLILSYCSVRLVDSPLGAEARVSDTLISWFANIDSASPSGIGGTSLATMHCLVMK